MIEKQTPAINLEYSIEKFDNEILLYSLSGTKAVYLNETACLIWEICDGTRTVEDIIVLLKQAYPQQEAQIRSEVITAIQALVENGVMTLNKK